MKTKPRTSSSSMPRDGDAAIPWIHVPEDRIPRRWRWHYHVMRRLREHLAEDLRLRMGAASEQIEPHSMNPADSATDESNRAIAVTLLSGESDAMFELYSAMHRILDGTYGVCEKTGKRIPAERLRAIPWTRYTVEAEAAIERERRQSAGTIEHGKGSESATDETKPAKIA